MAAPGCQGSPCQLRLGQMPDARVEMRFCSIGEKSSEMKAREHTPESGDALAAMSAKVIQQHNDRSIGNAGRGPQLCDLAVSQCTLSQQPKSVLLLLGSQPGKSTGQYPDLQRLVPAGSAGIMSPRDGVHCVADQPDQLVNRASFVRQHESPCRGR